MKKLILISIDGMRPDGLMQCGNPYVSELLKMGSYSLKAHSVFPSVTLPCHMTMFHGVLPERHGISTNVYTPMVRPVESIFTRVKLFGGRSAMYYGWHPLRDIARPEELKFCGFYEHNEHEPGVYVGDDYLTDCALKRIAESKPQFVFLYMVDTDSSGHGFGWMTERYLQRISNAIDNVKRVIQAVGDEYTVIVTSDHGGHARIHGTEMPEDMTVPMICIGEDFEKGRELGDVGIIDIAPTVTKAMKIEPSPDWEGRPVM